eukprot:15495057-Heterocapsa_arctica.AAC.1
MFQRSGCDVDEHGLVWYRSRQIRRRALVCNSKLVDEPHAMCAYSVCEAPVLYRRCVHIVGIDVEREEHLPVVLVPVQ